MNNLRKYTLFAKYFLKSMSSLKAIKNNNIIGFREELSKNSGIDLLEIKSIIDWKNVKLTIKYLPHDEGHVSITELLILSAFASKLNDKQNFLEIGTFDGITSFNCALNAKNSKIYTLDLPLDYCLEEKQQSEYLEYDKDLILSKNRKTDSLKDLSNITQLYGDSSKYDFSTLNCSLAFIDGAHDYLSVKSDTENVLKIISRPGNIFWHDYDVTNDVGKYLIEISKEFEIKWIKNTRLCLLSIS